MARKKPHEEHENHERWLVSYADFITLLFAFFVVMYAISSVNEGKYRVLSDALVAAFRSSPKSLQPIQIGSLSKAPVISTAQEDHRKPAMMRLPKMYISQSETLEGLIRDPLMNEQFSEGSDLVNIGKIADAVEKALASLVEKGVITVTRDALWIEVEIRDSILFPSGSARLQEEAVPVLEELARILLEFPNPLRVEGYTDNVPINTIVYPSNWELSAARAASVIRLFADAGIPPQRMVAQGYGEYRPVADNATPEGRAKNRRVVIVVLADQEVERLLGDRATAAQRRFLVADEGAADAAADAAPATAAPTAAETASDEAQAAGDGAHESVTQAAPLALDDKPRTPLEAAAPSHRAVPLPALSHDEPPAAEPPPADGETRAHAGAADHQAAARALSGDTHEVRPVRWRGDAPAVPVPAPPATPLLTPPPIIGGAVLGAPIRIGAPIAPLGGAAPKAAQAEAPPEKAGAPPVVTGDTLSDITHYR